MYNDKGSCKLKVVGGVTREVCVLDVINIFVKSVE
jgi:hypothetical protein